jgi:hypothetical protein
MQNERQMFIKELAKECNSVEDVQEKLQKQRRRTLQTSHLKKSSTWPQQKYQKNGICRLGNGKNVYHSLVFILATG